MGSWWGLYQHGHDLGFLVLQLTEKEEEKATLLTMCNELMNKLEREGISL